MMTKGSCDLCRVELPDPRLGELGHIGAVLRKRGSSEGISSERVGK